MYHSFECKLRLLQNHFKTATRYIGSPRRNAFFVFEKCCDFYPKSVGMGIAASQGREVF